VRVDAEHGLESLYRQDGERLWRAVAAYTGDREVASDAVAEAFAQALARGSELRDPMAWIWRVAFRVAAGELKERRRGAGSAPEAIVGPEEPLTDLLATLRALSPKQRAAVVLHHYAGYPVKEVAEILGSTSAAVRVHLSQGRRRLRGLLEANDG
jgi:RNA polymerase sigma-70 factor, ECF subfamily